MFKSRIVFELIRALKHPYNAVLRPFLPYKIGVLNGVAVRGVVKLLDLNDEHPHYEKPLIQAIRSRVKPGDHIVIVGGGLGVSTVVGARAAGPEGSVQTFEAGRERVKRIRDTVSLNQVRHVCTIHHGIVGEGLEVKGSSKEADKIAPNELPPCDVLELDCEGSELEILANLSIRPSCIIVEAHGYLDAGKEKVREELRALEYEVVDEGVEDSDLGISILTAVSQSSREESFSR